MWHQSLNSGPNSQEKPFLQSLDHSQLYQRRVLHLVDDQNERSEDVDSLSPTTGDYEDLSEHDWTDDQKSVSSAKWSSSPQFKSSANSAPALPARSNTMIVHSSSLPLHARVR